MKKVYIIDHITGDGDFTNSVDVEQYGATQPTYEDAMALFPEAVHACHLDDYWNGIAGVAEDPEDFNMLVIREIVLPC